VVETVCDVFILDAAIDTTVSRCEIPACPIVRGREEELEDE
jgi:hypothetical protein